MITKDNVLRTIASLKESTSDVDATLYRVYNFVSILLKENEALESQISQMLESYAEHLQHHVDKKKELEAKVYHLQCLVDSVNNGSYWYNKYQEVLSDMAALAYEHEDQEKYVGTLRKLNDKCREEIHNLQKKLNNVRDTRDHWEHLYNEEKREHEETKKYNEYLVRLASKRLNDILKLQESRRWADQQYYNMKMKFRSGLRKRGYTVLLAQLEHDGIL